MSLETVFLALFIVAVILLILQHQKVLIFQKQHQLLAKRLSRARKATADILHLSRNVITTDISVEEFLTCFVEYVMKSIEANGAAVLICRESKFYGCAVSGSFPPIMDVAPEREKELLENPQKHTEFFRHLQVEFPMKKILKYCQDKNFAFFNYEKPPGFPSSFFKHAPSVVITPINVQKEIAAILIVTAKTDDDARRLTMEDASFIERLGELAAMSIEIIQVTKERKEYEKRIQAAREEGMLQVSTGILHNIGNAITISKLAVLELKEKLGDDEDRPESLILDEVLPTLRKKVENETVQSFLKHDPVGSQYLTIMQELLQHIRDVTDKSQISIFSLESKLNHISEIIQLQQRFAGELGTESITDLASVIESAVKIFEESCNKRDVDIMLDFDFGIPDVQVDPSMLTQVFMNFIKNAIEAMDKDKSGRKHHVKISLSTRKEGEKELVVTAFQDNGPGISKENIDNIFNFGFSTKGQGKSRGFGLAFCQNTVERFDGQIEVDSTPGTGTTFKVVLPAAAGD